MVQHPVVRSGEAYPGAIMMTIAVMVTDPGTHPDSDFSK